MFRSRSWFGGVWKPKNPHSLEHLKYLYNVLSKNQTVSESNRSLLVETLRAIAEILIWGDQNDSTVFDFFLEKNMLSFFLKIMRQKCGSYVCVQLLQTLNILFENIRNETSLYYLLSNNHVNSIIVHKFDFSDEEVMAYYISFLKTLSLKLNTHTIHFFYNEGTHDFPLYTEAIKFFNNSESMVRIAVRTLTLNVYRVDDKSMLRFIRDKTAAPYFSNLVWFIGTHVFDLDKCIRVSEGEVPGPRLPDLVAEHLDHLHYLNDILCLEIDDLNQVLTEHLLHRLFVPTYIAALDKNNNCNNGQGKVSRILAIFLLSQVFLIMTHAPLVRLLATVIMNGNEEIFQFTPDVLPPTTLSFGSNHNSLNEEEEDEGSQHSEKSVVEMEQSSSTNNLSAAKSDSDNDEGEGQANASIVSTSSNASTRIANASPTPSSSKQFVAALEASISSNMEDLSDITKRPFLASVYESLSTEENDYGAIFALCLLHALNDNAGINPELLHEFFGGGTDSCTSQFENHETDRKYNGQLVDYLIAIIRAAVKNDSKVRVVTLQLVNSLLLKTVMRNSETSFMTDAHLALIEGAREENILVLQNYFKTDDLFLEIFEDEYLDMASTKQLSIEHLMMDSNLLLPPAGSPLTGIPFDKRLPCGEVERSRRAIRVYFILRKLSLTLRNEAEMFLPLTNTQTCVHIEQNLDLTNSDMLACSVITRDNVKMRRFLVIDIFQLILVEPSRRLGWGIAKFVGFLQDMEVLGDKDDSRCLHITIKTSPTNQRSSQSKVPILQAKFLFDDHIRCMAAKQRLVKGKSKARQRKLHIIAKMLDLNNGSFPPSPPPQRKPVNRRPLARSDRPMFTPIARHVPGLAKPVGDASVDGARRRSRDNSPSVANSYRGMQEEEIPLGNIQRLQGSAAATTNSPVNKSPLVITAVQSANAVSKPTSLPVLQQSQHVPPGSGFQIGQNTGPTNSLQINSPSETTPQSETSFMTIPPAAASSQQPNSQYTDSSGPSSKTKVKKKKGIIETV